ncbi:hypothetical protein Tco_0800781 [Tanacetum coccineum]|uniref:Reverse transcriptase domain-containing protein n=1 Tax=Tanacetum coccineum TaxID=301880 RepID=A0ABQ4ZYD2_9ASTR
MQKVSGSESSDVRGNDMAAKVRHVKQENVRSRKATWFRSTDGRKGSMVGSVRDEPQGSVIGLLGIESVRCIFKSYLLCCASMSENLHDIEKCLADANLHVPLDEIKVDKTLHFVKEPVEIMDREIRKLKRRKIKLVKVMWNSKHGPEFTWEHEYQMRIKYPQLSVDRVVKLAS